MAKLTQEELGRRVSLDRTAVSRLERGHRGVSVLELMELSRVFEVPPDWFTTEPQEVTSHREEPKEPGVGERLLSVLARDVELLEELDLLRLPACPVLPTRRIASIADAQRAAQEVREHLGAGEEPLLDLGRIAERLGLCSVAENGPTGAPDGMYRSLGTLGIAWIQGTLDPGRRRFTLAHEIGHHVFQDESSLDWQVLEEGEKVVNAFAIHLLLPLSAAKKAWEVFEEHDSRSRAILIAARFGVSWTAACPQLSRAELLSDLELDELLHVPPRRGEYVALGVNLPRDLEPPYVSPALSAAIVRAYRSARISKDRALEMLRGTLDESELPERSDLPLDVFVRDLELLP